MARTQEEKDAAKARRQAAWERFLANNRRAQADAAAEAERRANIQANLQAQIAADRAKREAAAEAQAEADAAQAKKDAAAAAAAKAARKAIQDQDALDQAAEAEAAGNVSRSQMEGTGGTGAADESTPTTPKPYTPDPTVTHDTPPPGSDPKDIGYDPGQKPTTEEYALDIPTEEEFRKLTPEEIAGDPIDFSDKIDDFNDVVGDDYQPPPSVVDKLTHPTDFTDEVLGVDAPPGYKPGKDTDYDPGEKPEVKKPYDGPGAVPKPQPDIPTPVPTPGPTPDPTPEPEPIKPPDYTDRNLEYIGNYSALANLKGRRGSAARNTLRQMQIDRGTDNIRGSIMKTLGTTTPGDRSTKEYQSTNVLSLVQKYTSPADIIKSLNEWQSNQSNL